MDIILLSGGAGIGKSTLATTIAEMYEGICVIEAKHPIFAKLREEMGIGYGSFRSLYDNRDTKEAPHAWLKGLSPREYFIEAADRLRSEQGRDIVSVRLIENIIAAEQLGYSWTVVPDIRGDSEALHMILEFSVQNVFSFNLTRKDVEYNAARRSRVTVGNVVDMEIVEGSPEITAENLIQAITGVIP